MILLRFISDIVLFFSIFLMPYWFSILLALILFFIFENYIELVFAGLIIDFIYSIPLSSLFHFQFVVSLLGLVLCMIAIPIKRRLRFYK